LLFAPFILSALFLALLDSLVKRLKNSRVHCRDHVNGSIEFFFGHARFPCVRKAAFHSRIAEPHHRHGQSHQHLLAFAKTSHGMGIAIERAKISFVHLITPAT
jgi:hypothetical protein